MRRVLIFGNSGAGKSTLAQRIARDEGIGHLDLDVLAWLPTIPPERCPLPESSATVQQFIDDNADWVIEGCYADLLAVAESAANEVIFLDLPVEQCVENAKRRPWEPHKYPSKADQDANLEMLIDWIAQYPHRDDLFSQASHRAIYDRFSGTKSRCTSNH